MKQMTENLSREIGPVRVSWVCLGEGYNGEYDPMNPKDELLLRFDVAIKDDDIGDFVITESRCTYFAANAPVRDKEAALDVLLSHFHNAFTSNPRHSMRFLADKLSHISADTYHSFSLNEAHPAVVRGFTKQSELKETVKHTEGSVPCRRKL